MFKHILIPLDGSPRAEKAIPLAVRIARACGSTVRLMEVVALPADTGSYLSLAYDFGGEVMERDISNSTTYLQQIAASEQFAGIPTEIDVPTGMPASIILSTVESQQVDLIVMCSHDHAGFKHLMLGSVAQKVIRHCSVPVLVVREDTGLPTSEKAVRLLVALDGSELAEAVLTSAAQLSTALSAPFPGELHLVRVLPSLVNRDVDQTRQIEAQHAQKAAQDYLNRVAHDLCSGELAPLNFAVTSLLVYDNDVAGKLVGLVENVEETRKAGKGWSNVIAMATHGRGVPQRWIMGSVTERVLGTSSQPLLILHPQVHGHEHPPVREPETAMRNNVG